MRTAVLAFLVAVVFGAWLIQVKVLTIISPITVDAVRSMSRGQALFLLAFAVLAAILALLVIRQG